MDSLTSIVIALVGASTGILAYMNNRSTARDVAKVSDRKVELEAYNASKQYYDETLKRLREDYASEKLERQKTSRNLRIAIKALQAANIPLPPELEDI